MNKIQKVLKVIVTSKAPSPFWGNVMFYIVVSKDWGYSSICICHTRPGYPSDFCISFKRKKIVKIEIELMILMPKNLEVMKLTFTIYFEMSKMK